MSRPQSPRPTLWPCLLLPLLLLPGACGLIPPADGSISCTDPAVTREARAKALRDVLPRLKAAGLEVEAVDARRKQVVVVPRDLCRPPGPTQTSARQDALQAEARRVLSDERVGQGGCDDPPIVIVTACVKGERDAPPAER